MGNHIKPKELAWTSGKVIGFQGKDLLDLPNGGLKLVKVAPHAVYPTHQHPDKTEFVYILEGNPKIIIADKEYLGNKGEFIQLPQGVMHSIENPNITECKLLVGVVKS